MSDKWSGKTSEFVVHDRPLSWAEKERIEIHISEQYKIESKVKILYRKIKLWLYERLNKVKRGKRM